jgi:hypothetical protein
LQGQQNTNQSIKSLLSQVQGFMGIFVGRDNTTILHSEIGKNIEDLFRCILDIIALVRQYIKSGQKGQGQCHHDNMINDVLSDIELT